MTDTHVTIDTATGTLHGTITGLPEPLTGVKFMKVAFHARDIAEAAHAAYWMEDRCEVTTRFMCETIRKRLEELRDLIEGRA